MRAKEFIKEGRHGSLQPDVAAALPATYVIPALRNQDPYLQYRFGIALAQARARLSKENPPTEFEAESTWGENAVIVSYSNTTKDIIDDALKQVGLSPSDKKLITSAKSEEIKDVSTVSPVAKIKKNRYGI